jgi:NAD(P)H-nitrite reductase large subunit
MPFMLGRSTAQVVLEALAGQGIDVRLETKAEAFTGKNRAKGVLLGSGEELAGDILVAATGVQPNLEFLEGSGIKCNEGILVDDRLCTNHPEIYAAGDVTQSFDIVMRKPVMNAIFPKAVEQGTAAGINAAGGDALYEGSVRMNSLKHLDLPVIAAGLKEARRS